MNGKVLTTGMPWRAVLRFALPLMAANILQQLYNTVDTLVVGNFDSQTALSAVGSCAYLTMLYLAVATGFSLGAGVLVAQRFGAGDEKGMRRHAGTAVLLLLVMGAGMTVFALLTGSLCLRYLISVPESVFAPAVRYIRIYALGLIFQFGYNVIAAILRAVGDSKSSLYFLATASALNILLDLLFVGAFRWGVTGAALATTFSQLASMLVCFTYMFKKYPLFRPNRETWRWDGQIIARILKTGFPMAVQTMIVSCGFMLLQRLVNTFGETMTASYTVACRLECYMLVPFSSFASAMATYSGQNFGAGETKRLTGGVRQTVGMALVLAVMIGVPSYIFAPQMVGWFGLEGQAAQYSVSHVRLVAFDLLLCALYQPFIGFYQGIGKGVVSTALYGVELTGRIVFAYALSGVIGPACAWWGEPFAWIAVVLAAYTYFFLGRWKRAVPVRPA